MSNKSKLLHSKSINPQMESKKKLPILRRNTISNEKKKIDQKEFHEKGKGITSSSTLIFILRDFKKFSIINKSWTITKL